MDIVGNEVNDVGNSKSNLRSTPLQWCEVHWNCDETTDGYGMGGVLVESIAIDGASASITKEDENEFEIDINLKHPIFYNGEKEESYEIIEYRSSRNASRLFAERYIKADLMKNIDITEEQKQHMRHCIGLNYKKKPYRNYFCTEETDESWNDLVEKRLAVKGMKYINNDEFIYFWLTKFGVEYITGKPMSDKRYEDL